MSPRRRAQRDRIEFQRTFAALFEDSLEFTDEHLRFLERRRDQYFQSLRAS
jgi:hypothetical protein